MITIQNLYESKIDARSSAAEAKLKRLDSSESFENVLSDTINRKKKYCYE